MAWEYYSTVEKYSVPPSFRIPSTLLFPDSHEVRHVFDDETNRDIYYGLHLEKYLVPLKKQYLGHYMEEAFPEAVGKIAAALGHMQPEWSESLVSWFHEAFPEYRCLGYDLGDIMCMEALQAESMWRNTPDLTWDLLECMAGKGQLSKAYRKCGMVSVRFDKKYSQVLDMSSAKGFRTFVEGLRHIKRQGLLWMGIECTTWIWIGRSTTGRSSDSPLGDVSKPHIRQANDDSMKAVFMCAQAWATGRFFIIEQPMSSLLNKTGHFQALQSLTGYEMVTVEHGHFPDKDELCSSDSDDVAASSKPLKLMGYTGGTSNSKGWHMGMPQKKQVKQASSSSQPAKRQRLSYKNKKGGVCGKKDALEDSEHYSLAFGLAVCELHKGWLGAAAAADPPAL